MLARTNKTAAELDIPQHVYDGLIEVRDRLASGELKHAKSFSGSKVSYFNMAHWNCGSAACIGGWVELVTRHKFRVLTEDSPLFRLFFPPNVISYQKITAMQAVKAIDNFLRDGEPRWLEVMKPHWL